MIKKLFSRTSTQSLTVLFLVSIELMLSREKNRWIGRPIVENVGPNHGNRLGINGMSKLASK